VMMKMMMIISSALICPIRNDDYTSISFEAVERRLRKICSK
jgi:dihydrodipicolinate synthase/N-acetylneuraminate lyase